MQIVGDAASCRVGKGEVDAAGSRVSKGERIVGDAASCRVNSYRSGNPCQRGVVSPYVANDALKVRLIPYVSIEIFFLPHLACAIQDLVHCIGRIRFPGMQYLADSKSVQWHETGVHVVWHNDICIDAVANAVEVCDGILYGGARHCVAENTVAISVVKPAFHFGGDELVVLALGFKIPSGRS